MRLTALLSRSAIAMLGFTDAALLISTALALIWRNRLSRPLAQPRLGVRALSNGDFAHRITITRQSEIAEVATVLDKLAARVDRRERTLLDQNTVLEAVVADCTADLTRPLEETTAIDDTRRQMMADVSYELRTPLTIIIGESDIALREAASHTSIIVEELLFMARNEAGWPKPCRWSAQVCMYFPNCNQPRSALTATVSVRPPSPWCKALSCMAAPTSEYAC